MTEINFAECEWELLHWLDVDMSQIMKERQ